MRKLSVIFLVILFIIIVRSVHAQDYMKIRVFYYPTEMFVEQGKTNSSQIILQNLYNDILYGISLKFNTPVGLQISQDQRGVEELWPNNQTHGIRFNLTAAGILNGTYNVTFWAESSLTQIGSNNARSPSNYITLWVFTNTSPITISTTLMPTTTTTTISQTPSGNTTPATTTTQSTNIVNLKIRVNADIKKIVALVLIIGLVVLVFVLRR